MPDTITSHLIEHFGDLILQLARAFCKVQGALIVCPLSLLRG